MNNFSCTDRDHCITCSDEAVTVKVLGVDLEMGTAMVEVQDQVEEVDITLVEHVEPGDLLLVHGGVAMSCLEEHETPRE